jgi:hypothetical protein
MTSSSAVHTFAVLYYAATCTCVGVQAQNCTLAWGRWRKCSHCALFDRTKHTLEASQIYCNLQLHIPATINTLQCAMERLCCVTLPIYAIAETNVCNKSNKYGRAPAWRTQRYSCCEIIVRVLHCCIYL